MRNSAQARSCPNAKSLFVWDAIYFSGYDFETYWASTEDECFERCLLDSRCMAVSYDQNWVEILFITTIKNILRFSNIILLNRIYQFNKLLINPKSFTDLIRYGGTAGWKHSFPQKSKILWPQLVLYLGYD